MSNSNISSIRRHRDKRKRQLQQRQYQIKQNSALYQARQQATQMGLVGAQRFLSESKEETLAVGVLETMQQIWSSRGTFSPANLANIFLQQMEGVSYAAYKRSLMQYLWTAIATIEGLEPVKQKMQDTLAEAWPEHNDKTLDTSLKLRTCNRLIHLITTQGQQYPSPMFTFLAVQEQYDVFGLLLLRLMLLSRPSYQRFAEAIAVLEAYYAQLNNPKSQWIVSFLEVFQLNISEYLDRDFDQKNKFQPYEELKSS